MGTYVIVGKDIYKQFSPKDQKKKFTNVSMKYDEFYEFDDGSTCHITEFSGDDYFTSRDDLMEFAGVEWDDFDAIDDLEVYVMRYYSFGDKDEKYWRDLAKDCPHQLRFRPY